MASPHSYQARRRTYRPLLEGLEDRTVLSDCAPDPRRVVDLDPSWRFYRGDVPGAHQPDFNDSAWGAVGLPHTWNNLDGQDGGGNNYYRGVGWYRRHLLLPRELAGKELFVRFDGANLVTELFVNGISVGTHAGGFAAFAWDVTPHLMAGADNVLAVKVNNARNNDIAPLSGDFTMFGGLYRSVRLVATAPLHVSLTDHGSPGVYLTPTDVSAAAADLRVTTKVRNDGPVPATATVEADVVDADGNPVATLRSTQVLAAGSERDVVQSTRIMEPHLWNGVSAPYLYQVCVSVRDGRGKLRDRVQQPLGFRSFHVDPAGGFSLNGRSLDLHGVNFHQDRLDKGWAVTDADRAEDVALVREMGATFVRLAHYQHGPRTYDLLDQAGLVAWTEIPLVENATASPAFFANARQQLRELIRQNYNHPAVVFWGLFNEIPDNATTQQLVAELAQFARAEDPTRLTTAASFVNAGADINQLTDVIAFNKYNGWYGGSVGDFGLWVDTFRRVYPNRALGISEYGAGASVYQHEADPPPPNPIGSWHPEEYQTFFHEAYWNQMRSRPFLWTKAVWNMFDFASDGRNEGDTPGRNDKGLVTFDRRVRKDAFYWYKANWSAEPVLHLTGRRWLNRPAGPTDVKVYANLDEVGLWVNGVSLGTRPGTHHVFRWAGVALAPGENQVVAVGRRGENWYFDVVTWYTPRPLEGVPFLWVNFQPTGVPVPPGYVADHGAVFGDRGNGRWYGWDTDNTAWARVRGVHPDPRYDTLTHLQMPNGGRVWEVALPPGVYDVYLVAGDPSFFESLYRLEVEGVLAVSGTVDPSRRFHEAWRRVTVRDSLLTVTSADGARNAKINFLEIHLVELFGGGPGGAPVPGTPPVEGLLDTRVPARAGRLDSLHPATFPTPVPVAEQPPLAAPARAAASAVVGRHLARRPADEEVPAFRGALLGRVDSPCLWTWWAESCWVDTHGPS